MYATLINIFFYFELSLSFIHLEHFFVRLIWILAWFKISRPSNDSFLGFADLKHFAFDDERLQMKHFAKTCFEFQRKENKTFLVGIFARSQTLKTVKKSKEVTQKTVKSQFIGKYNLWLREAVVVAQVESDRVLSG